MTIRYANLFQVCLFLIFFYLNSANSQPSRAQANSISKLPQILQLTEEQMENYITIVTAFRHKIYSIKQLNQDAPESLASALWDMELQIETQMPNILDSMQQEKFRHLKDSLIVLPLRIDPQTMELKELLHLNKKQTIQMYGINFVFRTQIRDLRDKFDGDREMLFEKFQSLVVERNSAVQHILTDSQWQQYQKYIETRRKRGPGRRGDNFGGRRRR